MQLRVESAPCFENRSGRDCERGGAAGKASRRAHIRGKSVTDEQRSQTPRPAARPPDIFSKHALSGILVPRGWTVLSAIVFHELREEDGDAVSLRKVPQHIG